MMIPMVYMYVSGIVAGLYFLYQYWVNTRPDTKVQGEDGGPDWYITSTGMVYVKMEDLVKCINYQRQIQKLRDTDLIALGLDVFGTDP